MQQQPGSGFRLIVRRGPQPNQIHELNSDVITLGRDITNDITINDPEVSRHHARLTRTESGYTIEDLGSTNG
ncbi:MAG TPA: FHA domain-containing protein, partial [Aggregatilineales bacterium]|nr:FHA domain-containing protein [Aggregatilineales bacterium]